MKGHRHAVWEFGVCGGFGRSCETNQALWKSDRSTPYKAKSHGKVMKF